MNALGWDTTITVPGWALALALSSVLLSGWFLLVRWFDRAYLDPWLRRRLGLPAKNPTTRRTP